MIYAGFEELRAGLVGTNGPVLVFSDPANLQYFMKSQKPNLCQVHWAAHLSSFWFQILHTPGKDNLADPASRRPDYEEGWVVCPLITLLKHALLKGGITIGSLSTSVSSLDIEFSFPTAGT